MFGEIPFHGLDPMLLHIAGPIGIRWYGLAYLVGFGIGVWILRRLAKEGFLPLVPDKAMDLLGWLVLGVILGGRLGYVIFYDPALFMKPAKLIAVWQGGLSFHGGLLGVIVAALLFSWKNKVNFWRLGDCLTLAVTPGIFSVRIANFINGELFGRICTDAVPWAMRFPRSPAGIKALRAAKALPRQFTGTRDEELAIIRAVENGTWDKLADQVPLRHPSQIYEALSEGLLLGLILWAVYLWTRKRSRPLGTGTFMAIFLAGYGLFRFFIEFVREPDAALGFVLGPFSRGQELCFGMIVLAAVVYFWRRKKIVAITARSTTDE